MPTQQLLLPRHTLQELAGVYLCVLRLGLQPWEADMSVPPADGLLI